MAEDDNDPRRLVEKSHKDTYVANKCRAIAVRGHVSNELSVEEYYKLVEQRYASLPAVPREQWQDRNFTADTSNYDLPNTRVVTVYESPPVRNTLLGCRRRW